MNRETRLLWVCIAATVIVLVGCVHKPAYSDMDANRVSNSQNKNQPVEAQTPAAASVAEAPTKDAASTAPAATPAPSQQFKTPSFLNQASGDVKDVPSYPGAYRVSAQIGPIQGLNTISLGLRTFDPMDRITAFYEQAIKSNAWTVSSKVIDPEFAEWNLKKSGDQVARVQVKKDLKTNAMNIVIVRTEKLLETAK